MHIVQIASIFYWLSVFLSVVWTILAWRRTSASLNYERFHGHPSNTKVDTFTPSLHIQNSFQVHLHYTWKL